MNLYDLQSRVGQWVLSTFGRAVARDGKERVLRLIEEAVEFGQAVDLDPEQVHRLVDYVYLRPKGVPGQEAAGTQITLCAAAEALGISLTVETYQELDRIHTPEVIERCQRRQAEKREANVTGESK